MIDAFHSASANVLEATNLGIAFILLPNSPVLSSIAGHDAAKPSYVTRPSSSASPEKRYSSCSFESSSSQNGVVQAGFSTTPSSETYIASLTFLIVSPPDRVAPIAGGWDRNEHRISSRACPPWWYLPRSATEPAA